MIEVNFDGLVGPSHNYAGLSIGNMASTKNAGDTSAPRLAALQGLVKMRRMVALGLPQGILLPHRRPDTTWLRSLGFTGTDAGVLSSAWRADPVLLANAFSASAMWAANAATVSPGSDTTDGRCHISVANLSSMLHRSVEPAQTERQLRIAFRDAASFCVHPPLPACLGDEGAANVMRIVDPGNQAGATIFVYGEASLGGFPARQSPMASRAIARRHGLDPARTCFARQSDEAIAAGAFHNDVVAVSNGNVLFAHEQAFADPAEVRAFVMGAVRTAEVIEVPAARVDLGRAVRSYLFNSQLVSLGTGGMALILPRECQEDEAVWAWLEELVASGGPVKRLEVVDVRESMRNGGGPACLRLRVQMEETTLAAVDERFILDEAACDRIEAVINARWPESIAPNDLGSPALWRECGNAREALLEVLGFSRGEL